MVATRAIRRASAAGASRTGTAATSGSASNTWRIQRSKPMDARKEVIARYRDLGYDFLKSFTLTLDYQRRVIRLTQGGYEVAGAGGLAHAQVLFRLAGPVKPLVMVPAFVNGRGPHAQRAPGSFGARATAHAGRSDRRTSARTRRRRARPAPTGRCRPPRTPP